MTQQQIEAINKLVADFMGATVVNDTDYDLVVYGFPNKSPGDCYLIQMKYHSSWDWLMPVVEKISKMPLLNLDNTPCDDYIDTCYPITFNMPTEDGKVMFRFKGFSLHEAENLIDAVYAAVVEVAEYHHSQPQQP